jgi:hypothetical protein
MWRMKKTRIAADRASARTPEHLLEHRRTVRQLVQDADLHIVDDKRRRLSRCRFGKRLRYGQAMKALHWTSSVDWLSISDARLKNGNKNLTEGIRESGMGAVE